MNLKDEAKIYNSDDIAKQLKIEIDENTENFDEKKLGELELERQTLLFSVDCDELRPKMSGTDDNGFEIQFPNINSFTDKAFEFIDSKFNSTTNLITKAHYGHFLHLNGFKHIKYLDGSKKSYFTLIRDLISQYSRKDEKKNNKLLHQIIFYLRQLYYVSDKLRDTKEFKSFIQELIADQKYEKIWFSAIDLVIASKKVFTNEEVKLLSETIIDRTSRLDREFDKIYFYELGQKIDQKTGIKSQDWKTLLAIEYESLANKRTDNAAIDFANKATLLYKEAGDLEASERCGILYLEKAKNKQMGSFGTKIDITEYVKHSDKFISKLKNLSAKEIIDYMSINKGVLVEIDSVKNEVPGLMQSIPTQFIFGSQIYDKNGHVSKYYRTEEEKYELATIILYRPKIQLKFEGNLDRLFYQMIGDSELSAESMIEYLKEYTWLGNPIVEDFDNGTKVTYSKVDLLSPGIISYFNEISTHKNDPNYECNFTLAKDSLTLKIEGILRQICSLIGVQTFRIRRDENQREITQEKDINMLLREPKLKILLGEDLLYFMNYVLVEKFGHNLRNDIAHSFLKPYHYKAFSSMNMIILIILRLSGFEFIKVKDEGNTE